MIGLRRFPLGRDCCRLIGAGKRDSNFNRRLEMPAMVVV
jgi:hypothetical protein